MKVKLLGGGAFYGPHGVMESYGPNSVIEVDDSDKVAVKYWNERVTSGAAELVEAPPQKPEPKASTERPEPDRDRTSTERGTRKRADS
jgi:hypothetical protein